MSISATQSVMDRYFKAMGAEQDLTRFFDDDVTWLMVDSGQEVRGPEPVRDYILDLHNRMLTGQQRALVVTDGHAFLEGHSVNAGIGNGSGLAYCLVYDVSDDRISAMDRRSGPCPAQPGRKAVDFMTRWPRVVISPADGVSCPRLVVLQSSVADIRSG